MEKKLPNEPKYLIIILEDGEKVILNQHECVYDKSVYDKKTGKLYCLKKDELIIEED